jgi:mono/diheme cytochrome c family protein
MNQPTRTNMICRTAIVSLTLGALMVVFAGAGRSSEKDKSAKVEYNRDIRPILAENCFACHGPDSASRKAGLRLDQRDAAVKAEAIVPGKADGSELVHRVFSAKSKEVMPPPKSKKTLTQAQKELLKRWVVEGAEYQSHWSLIAPVRPPLPEVKDKQWARNAIDQFILSKLEAVGLRPSPEADRHTLARRLSLDLTGLPPSPEDVASFVNDKAPAAYEKYVDRLLASPHWGEHRARYWLDAARYADTHGIHFDNYREIWAYRDWVINAFNRNLPFDQFTIEQLAGDLLPNATLDQRIATGFNRCNITTNEGGVIPEEYLVLYTRDRTETVSAVWMGLTANCAVCHDHKYDPLPMRDFYSMSAYFNNTTQGAMDGNIRDTPPIINVPLAEDRALWDTLAKEMADLRGRIAARKQESRPAFDKWLTSADVEQVVDRIPTNGLQLHALLSEGSGEAVQINVRGNSRLAKLEPGVSWAEGRVAPKALTLKTGSSIAVKGVGDFEKNEGFSSGAWVKVPRRGLTGALAARMDNTKQYRGWDLWMENDRVGSHIINRWPDDALKVTSKTPLQPNRWYHVFVTYDGSGKAAGVKVYLDGVAQPVDVFTDKLKSTIRTEVPFRVGQRHSAEKLSGVSLQDVRVYGRALSGAEVEQIAKATRAAALLAKEAGKRTPAERDELFDGWLVGMDQPFRELNGKLTTLQQEEATLRSRGTVAHVMAERQGEPTAYLLYRGEYDKRRDPVKAATPTALPPMPSDLPHNRLGFARWLLRPEHPLTARVTVNRFWQELFGTGIVRTTGDFGVSGELPSHPELLDWLAVEFRESGWDMKKLFKLMVTSSTYRQSAALTKDRLERDPQDRLLSRGPRYRLDAEMLRDYALASSGLLVRKIGGPSVKPYQPEGVWEAVAMIGSNTRDYRRDNGAKLYRRSMYTFWKRGAPPASMEIFNAPTRETCTVRRERTNTPLQALAALNDPQFVEAARYLAQRALKEGGVTCKSRLDFVAGRLLARPLRNEEIGVLQEELEDLLAYYRGHDADARKLIAVGESRADPTLDVPTLAGWTMLVNQMMNLDEVLNK